MASQHIWVLFLASSTRSEVSTPRFGVSQVSGFQANPSEVRFGNKPWEGLASNDTLRFYLALTMCCLWIEDLLLLARRASSDPPEMRIKLIGAHLDGLREIEASADCLPFAEMSFLFSPCWFQREPILAICFFFFGFVHGT